MEVFVETQSGSKFSIEVDSWDTLLDIKKKIEKSQGIPVSEQIVFFQGNHLSRDELLAQQYDIVKNSRLYIFFPNDDNYQVLQQTEQSQVPSNPIEDISNIEDSHEKNQDSSLMESPVTSDAIDEILNYDWSSMARSNDDHVVHQTEQSLESSMSIEEFLCGEDRPETTGGNVNIQDSSRGNNEYQDWLQMEPSPPSKFVGDFMFGEDQPLSAQHFTNIQTYWPGFSNVNQGFQTEQSPVPSISTEQRINTQDLPVSSNQWFQTEQWPVPSISTEQRISNIQDFPGISYVNQGFQTEQWPGPSSSSEQRINTQDLPVSSNQVLQTEHWTVPLISTEQMINIEDLLESSNQVFQQTEQSPVPLNSTEQRINTQDLPVSSNQVLQTEKSPEIKEVINVPDSPVKARMARKPPQKLRVMMLPYSREGKPVRKFPMEVNASEKVEELKKKLEKVQQRYQFKLPEEGYIFIHEQGQRVLDFDQSFRWKGVAHGDTIEIFPGSYTKQ